MKRKLSLPATIVVLCATMSLLVATSAYAATPTLSLVNIGNGSVQINVNGDPNYAVVLYYNVASSSGMQETTIGYTTSSGTLSTTINASSYGILAGDSVYVIVNNQQSAMQAWPVSSASGNPTLSSYNVTVGLGQSTTVTSETGASVYLVSNSNSAIASISTNGTQITVTGEQIGSTVASICYVGTASECTNLTVTVQSEDTSTSAITFSQNNLSLVTGASQSVTIYGGSGVYSISGNSNTSVVSTNLSGDTLTLYSSAAGSATITVCDQSGNCSPLSVTVNSSGSSSGSVVFGITNPTITVGQSTSIGLSGGSSYFISSNSNTNIIQASVNGSELALYGENAGSDSLTVCISGGGCNTLYITVDAAGTTAVTTTANSTVLSEIQSLETETSQALAEIQSIQSQLSTLATQVNDGAAITTTTSNTTTASSPATTYDFTEFLSVGSEDAQVTELQQRLTTLGYYSGPITGYYGALTQAAVEKYQSANGIDPVGYVGPSTRAALNAGS